MKTEKFDVTGMTCAACEANVTRCVRKLDGVQAVNVSLLGNRMEVAYDDAALSADAIIQAVAGIGYGASLAGKQADGFRSQWNARRERADDEQRRMKRRLAASVALLLPLMYIAMGAMLSLPLPPFLTGMENALVSALAQLALALPILWLNRHFFENGFKALAHRAPNMDSLVAVGAGASLLYGAYALFGMAYAAGHGDMPSVHAYAHALYFESAAMILTLVTVGKYLEARSKAKTSDALNKLIDLAPKTATVVRNGDALEIPAEQVIAGDIVVIRPGETLPVDGVVTEGYGYIDQSAITGESLPVVKGVGDEVLTATVNKNGSFRFRASNVGENTTLARIIRLVDEAGNTKAPIARLADKVSGVFVPVVMVIAVLTALVWLIAGQPFEFAFSNAVAVLVISCPCALGLATPVAIMVGTGKAAELGILIKSAESLERLHEMDTIVLDKTGTITSGRPAVTDVIVAEPSLSESDFLAIAAAAESGSEHPLAFAILEYAKQQGVPLAPAEQFTAEPGRGVRAVIRGKTVLAGNAAYLRENHLPADAPRLDQLAKEGKTPLLFAQDGKLLGIIAVADTIRETSRAAIGKLQSSGIRVVMLTGDNRATAEAIARQLGVEEVLAEVLPTEKEACIRKLQRDGRKVVMVGDGINDAPALTRADIGIAIGAGTDIAIDSADVVLLKNSLGDVVTAIELSRAVVRNIRMNLFWAFFYNVLGIPIAAGALYPALGLRLSPMLGSAAMSLSSVCVVTNALRLRLFKPAQQPGSEPITPSEASISEYSAPDQASAPNPIAPNQAPVPDSPIPSPAPPKEEAMTAQAASNRKGATPMKKLLVVEGMMCNHCKAHVEKALAAVAGVLSAEVDLEKQQALVALANDAVSDQMLMAAVSDAGYTAVSCETV